MTPTFICGPVFPKQRSILYSFHLQKQESSFALLHHGFFKYVQKLKDDHITAVSGTYGVDNIVTRAQMAAFLSRAFLGMQ
jgi:hypothetical protein